MVEEKPSRMAMPKTSPVGLPPHKRQLASQCTWQLDPVYLRSRLSFPALSYHISRASRSWLPKLLDPSSLSLQVCAWVRKVLLCIFLPAFHIWWLPDFQNTERMARKCAKRCRRELHQACPWPLEHLLAASYSPMKRSVRIFLAKCCGELSYARSSPL